MSTLTFYGFDPGPVQTGWARIEIDQDGKAIIDGGISRNWSVIFVCEIVDAASAVSCGVETVVPYGKSGQSVIDTASMSGQIMAALYLYSHEVGSFVSPYGKYGINRRDVKRELFGKVVGNDKTIRAYLISRWNLKSNHLKSHAWQALAVATVVYDRWKKERGL